MIKKVQEYVQQHKLIEDIDGIVVGVSGGADSICLLEVLWRLKEQYGYELLVVHIHHGIRGVEADEDQRFVEAYCKQRDIPCRSYNFDVKKEAAIRKQSEEEVGRSLRYEVFQQELVTFKKGVIAVAHHQNDQAETILFNLLRGSGLLGLCGMKPRRDAIIRPLLGVSRYEIETFLEKEDIAYRTDSTNKETLYSRNKMRLELIPYIQNHFNTNVIKHLNKTADLLRDEEDFLESQAKEAYEACVTKKSDVFFVDLESFLEFHSCLKRRILRIVMKDYVKNLKDITSMHIEDICQLAENQSGKQISLPKGIIVEKNYNTLKIYQRSEGQRMNSFSYTIKNIPDVVEITELSQKVTINLYDHQQYHAKFKNNYTKCFDYDKIEYNLTLRTRQPGDYINLKGMKGKKKLKDFFIDHKVPRVQRDQILLLAHGSEILWIIGYRVNHNYVVTDVTKSLMEVTISES